MKRKSYLFLTVFTMIVTFLSLGQSMLFRENKPDEYVRTKYEPGKEQYKPGEILIKFKDDVTLTVNQKKGHIETGIESIDNILASAKPESIEKLFAKENRKTVKRTFRDWKGKTFTEPSLHNLYRIVIGEKESLLNTIELIKKDINVEFAEPNYIFSIVNDKPVSGVLTENDVKKLSYPHANVFTSADPNDPLYSQQWHIPATHTNQVWNSQTTGDTNHVIAIIDSGIDWTHPDLEGKIWMNYAELNGIPGVDDDGNGFVDDFRGWDWINNDNNPMDDNSHGTHVAGIAGAKSNNGLGIAGVSWGAKVMAIKVFQSSGYGDAGTIAQGIAYAKDKSVTVINMSFGSYTRSLTIETILAVAYGTSVLVAASGNDATCIGPGATCLPAYPAALSFVLGIQATDISGAYSSFSNFDQDGPIISYYSDLLNYELKAPGSQIISLVPNGNYRIYSGTSMAAPVISGAVSLYKSIHSTHSQEIMWIRFINLYLPQTNLFKAINDPDPPSSLSIIEEHLLDTLAGDDEDGKADAGETINLIIKVRNTGSQANNVLCRIKFNEFEDTTLAQILNGQSSIGPVSAYATGMNSSNPFVIKFSSNIIHNRDVMFKLYTWNAGEPDTVTKSYRVTVENGFELAGILDTTLHLTPDKIWFVNNSFRIANTGTLILNPGTTLYLGRDISNFGQIIGNGTADSLVTIRGTGSIVASDWYYQPLGRINITYGIIEHWDNIRLLRTQTGSFNHCKFINRQTNNNFMDQCVDISFTDCDFRDFATGLFFYQCQGNMISTRCNFSNIGATLVTTYGGDNTRFYQCNFSNIGSITNVNGNASIQFPVIYGSNIIAEPNHTVINSYGGNYYDVYHNYWGTTDSIKITKMINDFWDNAQIGILRFSPFNTTPSDSAHGVVWKVLVDGINPLDSNLSPLGIGNHKFEVYFNREMDTNYTPVLTFGVRYPYTQTAVTNSASWSSDGKIWTAYKYITLTTGDGLNRIKVTGARDKEDFEIPLESQRFNLMINASGLASNEFTATAQIGKVYLEWNNSGLDDFLGFNMYRYYNITDTTYSNPVRINSSLIADTLYTDFLVTPGTKYHYYYKIIRTDLSETDSSKIVYAVPFNASSGDANGDMGINVLDVTTTVSYIIGQNPQPFLFDAADINHDSTINVLDVVGIVNLILYPPPDRLAEKTKHDKTISGNAKLNINGNTLNIKSTSDIGGIQLNVKGKYLNGLTFNKGNDFNKYTYISKAIADTEFVFVMYNMTDSILKSGNYTMGEFAGLKAGMVISNVVISDKEGNLINEGSGISDNNLIPDKYYLNQNYPNPFNPITRIKYGLPYETSIKLAIYDILGREVKTIVNEKQKPGTYEVIFDGSGLSSGVYFYRIETPVYVNTKKLLLLK